jgi:hypothetical protein
VNEGLEGGVIVGCGEPTHQVAAEMWEVVQELRLEAFDRDIGESIPSEKRVDFAASYFVEVGAETGGGFSQGVAQERGRKRGRPLRGVIRHRRCLGPPRL